MSESEIYMNDLTPAQSAIHESLLNALPSLQQFKEACEKLGFDFEERILDVVHDVMNE